MARLRILGTGMGKPHGHHRPCIADCSDSAAGLCLAASTLDQAFAVLRLARFGLGAGMDGLRAARQPHRWTNAGSRRFMLLWNGLDLGEPSERKAHLPWAESAAF